MAQKHLKRLKLIATAVYIGFKPLCRLTLIHLFVLSGFPSPVLQKMQDICELSSETSSNLKVCLGLFSRREGVSLNCRQCLFFFLYLFMHVFITLTPHESTRMVLKMYFGFSTPVWFVQRTDHTGENWRRMSCGGLQVKCAGVTDSADTFANFKLWENELVISCMGWPLLFFFFLLQLPSPFTELRHTCSTMHFHAHLQTGLSRAGSKVNVWPHFLCGAAAPQLCRFFFFFFSFFFVLFFFLSWMRSAVKSQQKANVCISMNRPSLKRNTKHCIGWWDAVQSGASQFFSLGC